MIHVDVGSCEENTNIINVKKRRQAYQKLFSLLENYVSDWKPRTISMDFGDAAILSATMSVITISTKVCTEKMKPFDCM